MSNYVITIGRELGSGGKAIGQMMAKELNIPVYDSRLIEMAAEESGFAPKVFKKADEVSNKGLLSSAMRSLSSPFETLSNFYTNSVSNESLFQIQTEIILKKAETENCIIVGRCADYILREHPRHLSIFVRANFDARVKFVSDREVMTREQAVEVIDKIDNQRSKYHDFYSETNWGDSRAYDICVNSSVLGLEKTAEFLLAYAKSALNI
ncbi:MAG: cytidylate kinase-like family protein [Bacteroides sp.]|nr:cytidylate kinase-like family protein [Roseburia sp.]MCM1346847.1 cytidylate kinase-like family protein [Bacteroides sp.]MCM1419937.1 cytidylate kinase-like family protein [Bacteroides sp.]